MVLLLIWLKDLHYVQQMLSMSWGAGDVKQTMGCQNIKELFNLRAIQEQFFK